MLINVTGLYVSLCTTISYLLIHNPLTAIYAIYLFYRYFPGCHSIVVVIIIIFIEIRNLFKLLECLELVQDEPKPLVMIYALE